MSNEVGRVRSIFAVAAGFFATAILSLAGAVAFRAIAPQAFEADARKDSLSILLPTLVYEALFQFAGGYITARIAIRRPSMHALVLGCLTLAFGIAGAVMVWDTAPVWYHLLALVLTVPVTILGAKVREWQLR